MHDLEDFRLSDMIRAGKRLRQAGEGADCMEEVLKSVVDFLYDHFCGGGLSSDADSGSDSDARCNALVRCFKTHAFGSLPTDLRSLAWTDGVDTTPTDPMRCLVLMASRGEHPAWNGRQGSIAHRVIPLATAQVVRQAPMISEMIRQMGLEVAHVVGSPDDILVDLRQRSFNVFHVEEALGSEYVPAQESFVVPYKVRSVVGMGGLLPSGELFVTIIFSKVRIRRETAVMFRTLALSMKLALLPFSGGRVFIDE